LRSSARTGASGRATRLAFPALAVIAGLALTGCAAEPAPVVTQTVVVTATPTPTPTPTPTATPTPTPTAAAKVVPEDPSLDPNPELPAEPLPEGPAQDLGAILGAQGAPVLDGAGVPISYKVLEGDSFFDIAQRFNVPMQQLLKMNPKVSGIGEDIYIRQVLNLDWTKTG
jgi:LysM repeat protein